MTQKKRRHFLRLNLFDGAGEGTAGTEAGPPAAKGRRAERLPPIRQPTRPPPSPMAWRKWSSGCLSFAPCWIV